MPGEETISTGCQVDFYVLKEPSADPGKLACSLALMTWERNQRVYVVAASETAAKQIDELMWQHPEGRFLPHAVAGDSNAAKTMINVGTLSALNQADVVINLCPEAVPQLEKYNRILEIVPFADREASRAKFRVYRKFGVTPRTQEID